MPLAFAAYGVRRQSAASTTLWLWGERSRVASTHRHYMRQLLNPKGIPSQSPGLERSDYPGWMFVAVTTPTGLRLRSGVQVGAKSLAAKRRNPFRVEKHSGLLPRVASQTRQPWALRRNPFGIGERQDRVVGKEQGKRSATPHSIVTC